MFGFAGRLPGRPVYMFENYYEGNKAYQLQDGMELLDSSRRDYNQASEHSLRIRLQIFEPLQKVRPLKGW